MPLIHLAFKGELVYTCQDWSSPSLPYNTLIIINFMDMHIPV